MKKMIISCFFMILLIGPVGFSAENPHIKENLSEIGTASTPIVLEWNYTFGGINFDLVESLIQTSDGGFAFAGGTESYGAGGPDFWLVKTNSSGKAEWNRTYGGTGDDYAKSIVQTVDGGFALSGTTDSYGTGNPDFWLVKTNSIGQPVWNKTFGGISNDWEPSMIQTSDGGFILAGFAYSGSGGADAWLVKTNMSGHVEWNRTFGGESEDRALSVIQTNDGGFAFGGETASYGFGSDFWLVKTDTSGQMEWNKTFGGNDWDTASCLIQTTDGGYALAGPTESFGGGSRDFYLVKTNINGQLEWNKTFGGSNDEHAYSLVQTSDGGYAIAGWTKSYDAIENDFWLVVTDSTGSLSINRTFGGIDKEGIKAVVQTVDEKFVLAGIVQSFDTFDVDIWLAKTNAFEGITETSTTPDSTSTIISGTTTTTTIISTTIIATTTTTTAAAGSFPRLLSLLVCLATTVIFFQRRRKI
jgi:hypothetical protein